MPTLSSSANPTSDESSKPPVNGLPAGTNGQREVTDRTSPPLQPTIPPPSNVQSSANSDGEDPTLIAAWREFLRYDSIAISQKLYHTSLRATIIAFTLLTSLVAISVTASRARLIPVDISLAALPWLLPIMILMPAVNTALLAYTLQFAPSLSWAAYRTGAEKVRRQIYLYRMKAGLFRQKPEDQKLSEDSWRRQLLNEQLQIVWREIADTGTISPPVRLDGMPALVWFLLMPFRPLWVFVLRPLWRRLLIPLWKRIRRQQGANSAQMPPDFTGSLLTPEEIAHIKEKVAALRETHPKDDGFNQIITGSEYIKQRIDPQLKWYDDKATADFRNARYWQVAVLISSAAATVAAAIVQDPIVALLGALTGALTLMIDLKMYGRTYAIYTATAKSLRDEAQAWLAKDAETQAKPEELANLVERVENIFEAERDLWMQQAVQSQTAVDNALKTIIRGKKSDDGSNTTA